MYQVSWYSVLMYSSIVYVEIELVQRNDLLRWSSSEAACNYQLHIRVHMHFLALWMGIE